MKYAQGGRYCTLKYRSKRDNDGRVAGTGEALEPREPGGRCEPYVRTRPSREPERKAHATDPGVKAPQCPPAPLLPSLPGTLPRVPWSPRLCLPTSRPLFPTRCRFFPFLRFLFIRQYVFFSCQKVLKEVSCSAVHSSHSLCLLRYLLLCTPK